MVRDRRIVRYSEAFRRQVVEELESGALSSVGQAQRRYGIAGATTVAKWVRRLGKNHLLAKVVRVEQPQEQTELERLRRQVRDLEHALAQTRMKELLAEAHFDLVCQKQGIDPATEKKKVDAELSRRRSAGPSRATKG